MTSYAPVREDDLYRALQRHLDRMPVPYPATESGVELRILKRLFSPEDARLTLCLAAIPEKLATIQRRVKPAMDAASLARALDGMAERGLIQRWPAGSGAALRQVGVRRRLLRSAGQPPHARVAARRRAVLGRGVRRRAARQADAAAAHGPRSTRRSRSSARSGNYDDVRAYIRASAGPFAVMNCICQQGKDLLGQPCRQTHDREHCLTSAPRRTRWSGAAPRASSPGTRCWGFSTRRIATASSSSRRTRRSRCSSACAAAAAAAC